MTQLLAATRPSLSIAGRVAYVVNHSFPHSSNGYAVRTHGVAAALAANGHSVIVINRPGRPWDIASAKVARADIVFQQDGVQYLCLPKPSQHNYTSQPQWAEAAADALEQAFRVYKPAVVVAASNWENAEPAMLAAKRLKLPFYYEVRGFWELSRASSDPSWQGSDEYKHAVDKETAIACAADKVITLNPLMQQQLVKRGVAADKIIILPNGVNALPQPGTPAKPGAALRVGYIGSFSAYEGLDDLLQAVALLRQSGLALSLNLVGSGNQSGIISSSDSRAAQQLQAKAEQLGIAQWVSINPRVANGAIAEYYQGVDLIVNPRRSYPVTELVSSLKPIEAAAYAKPVLLSDVAPNKLLADECSAFTLFNSGDVIDLAAKLKALLTNAALYQRCAEQGARWVAQQRLFSQLAQPLVQVLKSTERKDSIKLLQQNTCEVKPDTNKIDEDEAVGQQYDVDQQPDWRYPVAELVPHNVSVELSFEAAKDVTNRACVLAVSFYDSQGLEIMGPYNSLAMSAKIGAFSYLTKNGINSLKLLPPRNAVELKLGVRRWNAKHAVVVTAKPVVVNQLAESSKMSVTDSIPAFVLKEKPIAPAKALSSLIVAGIMDEFTTECFRHEVKLISPTPDNWLTLLEQHKPDLLFVESCWFGNANTWSGLIYGYTSNGPNRMDELLKLISYCRKNAIPTVFWAKEDPVHFSRFAPTAKLFDYVFTTDANMVAEYQKQYGIEAQPLAFFCQPQIHNPLQTIARNNKAAFAGSYYSDKKERCENFHTIMDALEQASITTDIYDRCFERGLAHFTFPAKYADKVIGTLKPEDMWKAYKGYRYTVNLNTVKHSPTMFARRVYESLASGTPVISNYSEGVRTQFGGIVCASDNAADILEYIDQLKDQKTYNEIAKLGVREVLGRHTLADRLEQVCERVGINVIPHLPSVNFEVTARTEMDVEYAIALFEQQTYLRKRLVVNLENANVLYPYLNRNTDEEIFRVKTEFAKPLTGLTFEHSLNNEIEVTALEDAAIATQYSSIQQNQEPTV